MTLTPSLRVEVAFGFGPLDEPADGDFVDISSTTVKVVRVAIARGRPSEFDNFPPGTAQITVQDLNRVLDPSNTSSPYNGQLLPRVPIRLRAKIGATYYPRFRGFVDGWPMQLGTRHTTVNIVASDAFKILQSTALPASLYEAEVLEDSPRGYWKLAEATGEKAVDSSGNTFDGTYSVVTTSRGLPPIAPYGSGSTEFRGIVGEIVAIPNARSDSLPITVELWFQSDHGVESTYQYGLMLQPTFNDDGSHEGYLLETTPASATSPTGGVGLYYLGSATDVFNEWNTGNLFDSQPHHLVVVMESTGNTLYHNGALVPIAATGASGSAVPETSIFVGALVGFASIPGRIGDVAEYTTALSQSRVTAHYTAGINLGDGETTGARVTRILDLIGWPASLRSIDTGEQILGPAVLQGTALAYLQSTASSEQGRLFISKDGKVTFHQRDRFITQSTENTSQFNFSDDGAGDASYSALGFAYDDRFVYNRAAITRIGGTQVVVDDAASQASYGPLTRSLNSLQLRDDAQSRVLGEYIVYRYKDPQIRAESWSLQPQGHSSSWANLFALEVGYRVTLEATPAKIGSQLAQNLHVEQITEQIDPSASSWQFTFTGSPVDPNAATYFTFGGTSAQSFGNGLWR